MPAARKQQKISNKKCTKVVDTLHAQTLTAKEQEHLDEMYAVLRTNSQLVWACKGLIDGWIMDSAPEPQKPLHRTIKLLIGQNKSDGCSRTIIECGLTRMARLDEGEFRDVENWKEELNNLTTFGLNGNKK